MKNVFIATVLIVMLAAAHAASAQSNGSSRDRGGRSSRDRSSSSDRNGRDSSRSDRGGSSSSSRSERSDHSSSSSRSEPSPSTQPSAASVASSPVAPSHPEAAPSADFSTKYAIVTEKNIFVRNRPPTRVLGSSRDSSRSPRRPEEAFVLRGIALQEGRNVAFIENTSAQSTQRLVAGDSVAGGKIVEMQYDSLEFETAAGKRERIRIGRNFLGDVSTSFGGGSSFASTSPTTGPTTGPGNNAAGTGPETPPLPNAENLSLEERMKLRAQQLRK